jgi:hypothetical protein
MAMPLLPRRCISQMASIEDAPYTADRTFYRGCAFYRGYNILYRMRLQCGSALFGIDRRYMTGDFARPACAPWIRQIQHSSFVGLVPLDVAPNRKHVWTCCLHARAPCMTSPRCARSCRWQCSCNAPRCKTRERCCAGQRVRLRLQVDVIPAQQRQCSAAS